MTVYFVYLLECSNGNYYTGYTTDLERRYQEHVKGSAKCKYTRSFPPRRMAAHWRLDTDLSGILKIEAAIKRLSKIEKKRLILKGSSLESFRLSLRQRSNRVQSIVQSTN
jgi:putative endonuclease